MVRLARSTAESRDEAARALAAFEAAHLRIALAAGPVGWLARYRPTLTIAAGLIRLTAVLAAADGIVTGCRPILDLGLLGFFAAIGVGLMALPLEFHAAREARRALRDLDPALISALPWRHVAASLPLGWRRSRGVWSILHSSQVEEGKTAPPRRPGDLDATARLV